LHNQPVALTRQDLAGANNLTHQATKAGWINPRRDVSAEGIESALERSFNNMQSNGRPFWIRKAVQSDALTLWKRLTYFLEYPELELSANLAENSMRPVALGRKNWIHVGSPQSETEGCSDSLDRGKLPTDENLRS
jgi:hypothetical protein